MVVTVPGAPLPGPNFTLAPRAKPVPVKCTSVWPRVSAVTGSTDVSVGGPVGAVFVNVLIAVWPSGLVTVTVATPPGAFGTRPTIDVELRTIGWKQLWVQFGAGGTGSRHVESVTFASTGTHATEPTETIAGDAAFDGSAMVAKPVPVIVIWVRLGPLFGSTEVIAGGADASN